MDTRQDQNLSDWHPWFAWYPVRALIGGMDIEWKWLRTVQRRQWQPWWSGKPVWQYAVMGAEDALLGKPVEGWGIW